MKNLLLKACTLVLLLTLFACSSGYPKDQLERDVLQSIKLENKDESIQVLSVSLVKTMDNKYEGFLDTNEDGEPIRYNLTVIVDGDEFIWEVY